MDRSRMEQGIRLFVEGVLAEPAVGGRLDREDLLERTPSRVASAWIDDLLAGHGQDPTSLLDPIPIEGASGPVILDGIRFTSVCAHHLLPYRGEALVAFLPREAHTGVGALARLIDCLSRRLTLQEELAAAIADQVERALDPRAVVVRLTAEHACLSVRGARKTGHRLTSIERRGEGHPDLDLLR